MRPCHPLGLVLLLLATATADAQGWDAERESRIRRDYRLDRATLLAQLERRVRDFDPAELDAWEAAGRLDSRVFDGERRYFASQVSNLFFADAGLRARRLEGRTYHRPDLTTAPRRLRVRMTVIVAADAVPAGETVRAWLPFPQEDEHQRGIVAGDASPDAPMRAVYREKVATKGEPVSFQLDYTYTRQGERHDLDPARARVPAASPWLDEQLPHVAFTPELRRLAAEIIGDESNPLRRARLVYDWCGRNLRYAYAREYSTITCIPEHVLERRAGDCGQSALLFITLCRLVGVPARWESGWIVPPGAENLHDWARIQIEPWGWIPVDPNAAVALNHADDLTAEEKAEIRDFYFGGLDSYRLVVNTDHGRPLVPAKRAWRSDTVDFQRGELEWGETNVYYDRFSYRLDATEVSSQ